MRETLHQLSLALALPITVGAFWIARSEQPEPVRERATAYRVELAQLPLPTRERLRSPDLATATVAPQQASEQESAPRERRPALPEPSETGVAPLDLASRGGSAPAVAAAPIPRPSFETLGAAPRNTPRAAPPVAMAAPPLSTRRADAAVAERAAGSATTAPAAKPGPSPKTRVPEAEPNPMRRERLLAQQDALPAAAPRRLDSRAGTPVASPDTGRPARYVPIAREPVRSDPRLVTADGRAPLEPNPKLEGYTWEDFSLPPGWAPSVLPDALPPLASEPDPSEPPIAQAIEPSPFLSWSTLGPRFLLVIPEPGSAILLGAALGALGALRRRPRA
jgi:hypothetical protein